MKKSILFAISLCAALTLSAQVTLYNSHDYYEAGVSMINIPCYIRLPYGALDSIVPVIVNPDEDRAAVRLAWGDEYHGISQSQYSKSNLLNYNHLKFYGNWGDDNTFYAFPLATIDSVYHLPIPTQSFFTYDTIVDYMPTGYPGRRKVPYPIMPTPDFSTDIPVITVDDASVAELAVSSWNLLGQSDMAPYMTPIGLWYDNVRNTVTLVPHTVGETQAVIRMGDVTHNVTLLVAPDTTNYTPDELYDRVFNRLFITGDMLPTGHADINGIDEGNTSFYRTMHQMQELPADHINYIWADYGIAGFAKHNWTAENTVVHGLYARLYYNIHLCNAYLDKTASSTSSQVAVKRAEVKFMRAFYYSYVLDLFGRGPICSSELQPNYSYQQDRTALFTYVTTELEDVLDSLPAPGQKTGIYRVDKAAAWTLLARIYLNGGIYNGTTNDSFYMSEASRYAQLAMSTTCYSLTPDYRHLFMGDNNTNGAMSEILLAAHVDGASTSSYGAQYMVTPYYNSTIQALSGISESWETLRSQKRLVSLFFPNGTSTQGTADDLTAAADDDRALFCNWYSSTSWSLPSSYTTTSSANFRYCWAIQKFTNLYSNGATPSSSQWIDTDIPFIRLAEAYLTYAEAQFRLGNAEEALSAVNAVRSRAHASTLTTLSLQNILDEWGREFYGEGRRRMDLIRFGKFSGNTGYTWEGKSANFDAHYNVYPIPQRILESNPDYMQNIGY